MKRWLRLLFLAVPLFATSSALPQVEPAKVLPLFKVSGGLEVTLWASEPMFSNPTIMDIDHKGRVWICESVNYRYTIRGKKDKNGKPIPPRPEGDRILILEDTKGTGKADKVTVFYQSPDLLAPLGIAVAPDPEGPGCKVYVCHSPYIYVFHDKDGTGKADGPPQKLLSGFKGFDHDHGVHGIFIGADNKLYFSVGDQGVQGLVDKKGRKLTSNNTDCRAGTIWRCDLDGKNLELIAHNFRNNYEPCADSFGTVFISDNDDDGLDQCRICYVMPGGNYGYHPRGPGQTHWHEEQPGVVPKLLRTFRGSPTGMAFYEGTLLPEKYRGQPIHVDAGPGRLSCYHLKDAGAAWTIDREDMVTSSDTWFRPSDVTVAPDGGVFICDWYDPGVGGHNMRDTSRGRIYRIAPKGNKPTVPAVDLTTDAGVRAALGSPNNAVRYMAMAKLDKVGVPRAVEILTPAAGQTKDVVLRARALWQLGRLGNVKYVSAAFSDPDPRFRILAMRILADYGNLTPPDYTPDWREKLASDPSPAVRREALLLMRETDPAKVRPLFFELARKWDPRDRFYLCALGICAGQDAKRREVLLGDFDKHFAKWTDNTAGLLWELRPPMALAMLQKHLASADVKEKELTQIIDALGAVPDTAAGKALLKQMVGKMPDGARDVAVAHLKRNLADKQPWASLRKSAELKNAVEQMLSASPTTIAALELIGAGGLEVMAEEAYDLARDSKAPLATRLAACRALGRLDRGQDYLLDIAGDGAAKKAPLEVGVEAVVALGHVPNPKAGVAKSLMEFTEDKTVALPIRQAAVAGLAATKTGATWLLEQGGQKKLSAELIPDTSRLLRGSPFPDIRKKAFGVFPAPPPLDPKSLPSIPALAARKGSVEKGQALIAASLKSDAQCLKCHTINGVGGQVGPDLSTIGSKASRENLLESILYPSRAIADQFQQWLIETKKGLQINGLIIEETKDHVLLRDANAKDYKIAVSDIDTRKKVATSLMPETIQYLSEQELVDIVEYLLSLKTTPIVPGAQGPAVPLPSIASPIGAAFIAAPAAGDPVVKLVRELRNERARKQRGWALSIDNSHIVIKTQLIEDIVETGPRAIPFLLEAMQQPEVTLDTFARCYSCCDQILCNAGFKEGVRWCGGLIKDRESDEGFEIVGCARIDGFSEAFRKEQIEEIVRCAKQAGVPTAMPK
jgi:putative membrane-bound dehydrogenase-like protein